MNEQEFDKEVEYIISREERYIYMFIGKLQAELRTYSNPEVFNAFYLNETRLYFGSYIFNLKALNILLKNVKKYPEWFSYSDIVKLQKIKRVNIKTNFIVN